MDSAIAPPLQMGVIRDARRRQRRRRTVVALACLAAVGAAVGLRGWLTPTPTPTRPAVPPAPHLVPAAAVFSQPPYLGVACPTANSIACDRVGLAVWFRHRERSVTAMAGGQAFALDWHGDQPPRLVPPRLRREFDGFLQPAHLRRWVHPDPGSMWFGEGQPSLIVSFRIVTPDGRVVMTREPVSLNTGWG